MQQIKKALEYIRGLWKGDPALTRQADAYLHSVSWLLPVMVLTALSNMFSLELLVYTLFAAVAIYVCLRGSDLQPIMPLVVACYVAPSRANNPGRNESSVFSLAGGGIWILLLAVAIAAALAWRIWKDRESWRKQSFALLPGMVILSLSYLPGGIGSPSWPKYTLRHLIFCVIQCVCLILPYVLFSGGVNWKKVRKDWFAWFGAALGCLLTWELIWIYLTQPVIVKGMIQRAVIYSGWGMYNNMGGLLMFMLPFPFYLGWRHKNERLGLLTATVFLLGILLSCSRSAILLGCAVYGFGLFWLVRNGNQKKWFKGLLIAAGVFVVTAIVLFKEPLLQLFGNILERGLNVDVRGKIYQRGLTFFSEYPVFGVSFFPPKYSPWNWSTNDSFTAIFPGRWHNTLLQLLATGGLVSFFAYCYHRLQTMRLFKNVRWREIRVVEASLVALLAASLFDCHFYNVGPVLYYAMGLAFAERIVKSQVPLR